ncbi:hypothetical protein BH09GEM1_BH09GEM1_45530 [soil metagenome]
MADEMSHAVYVSTFHAASNDACRHTWNVQFITPTGLGHASSACCDFPFPDTIVRSKRVLGACPPLALENALGFERTAVIGLARNREVIVTCRPWTTMLLAWNHSRQPSVAG